MTSDEAIQKVAVAFIPATYKRVLQKLGESPLDSQEIADYLGMTLGGAYKLLMMLKAYKVICAVEYRRQSIKGAPIKVWGLGSKDARPPPKISPAARSKAWRERQCKPKRPRKNPMDTFMKWASDKGESHGS